MSASTSNTTTTNADESVVETKFIGTDGTLDNGVVRSVVRKTGTTFTLAVAFNAAASLSFTGATQLTEYCEDAIEHFTAVKTAIAALAG